MATRKQHIWLFLFLLLYVAIAIIGFLLIFFVKQALQAPHKTSSHKKIVSGKPTNQDFKTYTNTSDRFKLSYPQTDQIQQASLGVGVMSISFQNPKADMDFHLLLMPQSLALKVGQNFTSYYTMPDNSVAIIANPFSDNHSTERFTKIKNITVTGNPAFLYQSIATGAAPNTKPEMGTFIKKGDNLILLATGEQNKEELEEMLSSFTSF